MSSKGILGVLVATLLGVAYVATAMVVGGDRRMLLISKSTDARHRTELSCETCHGAPARWRSEPRYLPAPARAAWRARALAVRGPE